MSLFTTHARTRGFWFFGLIFFILGPGGRESVLNDVKFSQASKTIEKTTIFGRERGAREKKRARTRAHQNAPNHLKHILLSITSDLEHFLTLTRAYAHTNTRART